ncbi:hypothetical protein KY342_03100 [Candidatus Woesearchaeota archaeon]|nr:hypothetical protein [Candidatus Woesearchaeota archaeon]
MTEESNDPKILSLFGDESLTNDVSVDIKDRLLKNSRSIPERETYLKKVHSLLSIIEDYNHPFFTKNFFDYLFVQTKDMEDRLKRDFIEVAKAVYDSVYTAIEEKISQVHDSDSIYDIIWPETNLVNDLGFDRENYERLKKSLSYRVKEEVLAKDEFSVRFYQEETVCDLVELLAEVLV